MPPYDIPVHNIEENVFMMPIEKGHQYNLNGTHSHSFYEILYFTQVEEDSVHEIDFVRSPIKTEYVYLIKPGQVYRMDLKVEQGFLIAVKSEYFNHIRMYFKEHVGYKLPNRICIDNNDIEIVKQIIEALFKETGENRRNELINTHLHTLLTFMMLSHHKDTGVSYIDNRISDVISLIEEFYRSEHETSFYAAKVSLGNKRLNALATRELGMTVKQLIQERLVLEAKRRISYGNETFKSIAFGLGFKDTSYFSRFFKQHTEQTPEEFKSSIINDLHSTKE